MSKMSGATSLSSTSQSRIAPYMDRCDSWIWHWMDSIAGNLELWNFWCRHFWSNFGFIVIIMVTF